MATYLQGGTVIGGKGDEPLPHAVVVFEGDTITKVGRLEEVGAPAASDVVIDVSGRYVIPGLINAHEHLDTRHGVRSFWERAAEPTEYLVLRASRNCLSSLIEGVTTVRDVGGKGATSFTVRKAIEAGLIKGPRVYSCGQPIAMTGGHGDAICFVADGVDAVRHAAREMLRRGADLVKCMASGGFVSQGHDQPASPQYTVDELRAAFDEAHWQNRPTTVHAHPPAAIRRAIEAGVDCIEHAALVDQPTAELLAEKRIPVVPTMAESWVIAHRGKELGRPQWLIDVSASHLEDRMRHYRYLVAAGVRLGCGTDVAGFMHEEMLLMHKGGLSAMQVLRAATRTNAEILGIADRAGTLEPGKWADVVVLDADPLADLNAVRAVRMVIKAGEVYDPAALRAAMGTLPL
ncbi:MAG: amidohydrolase family protein [Armatimonadota bacterium]|nr:amidohydrolase family protein [Armatimonadota bacterium]